MKKILVFIITAIMILSLAACGGTENPPTNTDDTGNTGNNQQTTEGNGTNNDNNDGDIAFTQVQTMLGYSIYCPEKCSVSNSKYGKAFSYESCSVILEAPAAVGSVFAVNGFDDVVENCKTYICASLESRNTNIFGSGATEQNVTKEEKVTVNGIEALRVTGTFKNTRDNTETEYVAYYLIATSNDGTSYPVYIVGISLDGNASAVATFMDEMAKSIRK